MLPPTLRLLVTTLLRRVWLILVYCPEFNGEGVRTFRHCMSEMIYQEWWMMNDFLQKIFYTLVFCCLLFFLYDFFCFYAILIFKKKKKKFINNSRLTDVLWLWCAGLFVEREQASTVVRQKRAAGQLSLVQLERYLTPYLQTLLLHVFRHVLIFNRVGLDMESFHEGMKHHK